MQRRYNLRRFVLAHEDCYANALEEIKDGYKLSCWMWFVFPQIQGLGKTTISKYYALADLKEASMFLAHPILGKHLREISQALLSLPINDAEWVMGYPDNLKLKSSMTLFSLVAPGESLFKDVLNKFFGGEADEDTLSIISKMA